MTFVVLLIEDRSLPEDSETDNTRVGVASDSPVAREGTT